AAAGPRHADVSGVAAIVPAAGTGSRVGGRRNKLFLPLAGEPLLAHTLRALQASAAVRWIVVAIRPEDRVPVDALLRRCRVTKALPPVPGGASRAESVASAFGALPAGVTWVLIHDGARPCLAQALVSRAVGEAKRHGAVACGLPASLTVKAADEEGRVRVTLDREGLWFVQTPQVFRRDWFGEALSRTGFSRTRGNGHAARTLERFPDDPTTCLLAERPADIRQPSAFGRPDRWWDDAALMEAAGFAVRMIQGDPLNIKVTTKEDVMLAEAILRSRTPGSHESRNRLRHPSAR
ncbi:MAG: hypothetical protein A3B78_01365, partial [Omnitrophica WOR_2 bacterium RIFCSPHIGHO2_02_FULL_67_20]